MLQTKTMEQLNQAHCQGIETEMVSISYCDIFNPILIVRYAHIYKVDTLPFVNCPMKTNILLTIIFKSGFRKGETYHLF